MGRDGAKQQQCKTHLPYQPTVAQDQNLLYIQPCSLCTRFRAYELLYAQRVFVHAHARAHTYTSKCNLFSPCGARRAISLSHRTERGTSKGIL